MSPSLVMRRLIAGPVRGAESDAAANADSEWCARLMSESEPWITLQRGFDAALKLFGDSSAEVYVAERDGCRVGFLILYLTGPFVGYIKSICVAPEYRGASYGTEILRFAETRTAQVSSNIFLCVSSFNRCARALYERIGYERVGDLKDFLVPGHDEILMRKTLHTAGAPPGGPARLGPE